MAPGTTQRPYRLIDSGGGRKLEDLGGIIVDRQAGAALWHPKNKGAWRRIHALHHRSTQGGGHWEFRQEVPKEWAITHAGLRFQLRLTPFGHIGIFPEQGAQWEWLEERARALGSEREILNLFAYTGGSTLALARGGTKTCHVDAAKGVVDWARRNLALNHLEDRPVRWIVDDCETFLRREIRRGRRYDGVVLDPPSFGRGPRKEAFHIEEALPRLLDTLRELLGESPSLLCLSCHSPGFTPTVLRNLLEERFDLRNLKLEGGEMTVREENGRMLPAGCFVRGAANTSV